MLPIDCFERGVRMAPDKTFVSGEGVSFTFSEAAEQISAIARAMHASGFSPGDSVAVYSPNHPVAVLCVFAAMRARRCLGAGQRAQPECK
jgi:fatty-acyl-CoA synthase